ncbi:hypothetical protein [Methylibium petroleiphilum]|uniref:Uncharacterized protein n=1 Tax=Methylibium petroleiphilum (strain ATCC BAA-1232 / LMG 22953 / PM1) TaxID=420662 RepID=A2SMV1_METPP|nr:hypothetical protein [Methylibium petroleiphilum]ABM96890.1 hypothetical protein Mpe_B0111 [Methylibium petroleiphilum PM1]
MNESYEEALAEFLPPWATGRAKGWTDIGAQLRTKDGRRIGNAVLVGSEQQQGLTFYQVLTDVGTLVHFTERELEEMFHQPDYTMNVETHSGYRRAKGAPEIHRESGRTADELWLETGRLRSQLADLKADQKSKIESQRDRFEAMYAAEGRSVNQPMPDFKMLPSGVYADMAIRTAFYWFNRQQLPDGWHLGGYLQEVLAAREQQQPAGAPAEPESLDAWIDQLVARFGISDTDVCGAADLVKLAFDNLATKIGEPGWSPNQFAESLVEALVNDDSCLQAGADIAELKSVIEQRARAVETAALSEA